MILSKEYERLYLQKDGAQALSVDLPMPLPQHQLDGIRFLHKQYKKKAPGVILNDPPGCGKCMQVTLFLRALKPVLKKPVLILSDSTVNWKQHFEIWTDCGNEIIIGNSNPFTKYLIKINPVKDGFIFSRRSWGIVVLHDEGNRQELLPLRFNADYKIWVTRDDLKENLNALASIYEWLHPNQKFDVRDFTAKAHNNRDVIEKAVLLDAFVEDFLLRRTDVDVLFEKPEYLKRPEKNTSLVKGRSRKNKDPTGTKVKRSRKNMIEDDGDETDCSDSTIKNNLEKLSNDNSMDTKGFIPDEGLNTREWSSNFQDSNVNIARKDKDPSGTKIKRSNTVEDNKEHKVSNDDCSISDGLNSTSNSLISNHLPISKNDEEKSENNVVENVVSDNKTLNFENIPLTNNSPESSSVITGRIITPTKSNETANISEVDTQKDSSFTLRYSQSETLTDINREYCNPDQVQDNLIAPDTEGNERNTIFQANTTEHDSEVKQADVFIPDTSIKTEKSSLNDEKNISFISNKNYDSKADNEVDKINTNNVDDFDAKLAEIEAKALKKLKGSILDSIF